MLDDTRTCKLSILIDTLQVLADTDALRKRLDDYDTRLSAEMLPDFKDWHQNSRDEWPEIAAWVIRNLRAQLREADHTADLYAVERDALEKECERRAQETGALERRVKVLEDVLAKSELEDAQ